jgi:hypothetical protein
LDILQHVLAWLNARVDDRLIQGLDMSNVYSGHCQNGINVLM